MLILRSVALIGLAMTVISCASSGPYRTADAKVVANTLEGACQELYAQTDAKISAVSGDFSKTDADRDKFLWSIDDEISKTPDEMKTCWQTAYERHADYDLYYAEFDDAGQATDTAKRKVQFNQSELYLIERSVKKALDDSGHEGLDIVVFTHGWHGNARADNDYSIEFKAILLDIAAHEKTSAMLTDGSPGRPGNQRIQHRVFGIEIA